MKKLAVMGLVATSMIIVALSGCLVDETESLSSSPETNQIVCITALDDPVPLLSWFYGGSALKSYVQVNLNATTSIQFSFVTLDGTGAISADTASNSSVAASSVTNVGTESGYFNFSLDNAGDTASYVYQFSRTTDAFGDDYVNVTADCTANDNYTLFNVTLGRVNTYTDSDVDRAWWVDVISTTAMKPYYWFLCDRSDLSYHALKTNDDSMILITTNSGNHYNAVRYATYNTGQSLGYWSTLVNDEAYAQRYDVDGRLVGGIKLVTPTEKERYGNVLILLPGSNYTMLDSLASNETIYANAHEAGVTHVYLETFDINAGIYTFTNASVETRVLQIRSYAHEYDMQFVIPCYWKAYTSQGSSAIGTYSAENRTYILTAWENYLDNQGSLTDEYSIGYADFKSDTVNPNTGWAWWNYNMLEEALGEIEVDKPISLWSHQMWFTDASIIYLNTESYKNWQFDDWDNYFAEYSVDPSYEMCGMRTWAYTAQVTMATDSSALWSQANLTFDARVLRQAYQHGSGITVFYHESLYAANDGFSLPISHILGLVDGQTLTERSVSGLLGGAVYADDSSIVYVCENITSEITTDWNASSSLEYLVLHALNESDNENGEFVFSTSVGYAWFDVSGETETVLKISEAAYTLNATVRTKYTPDTTFTYSISVGDAYMGFSEAAESAIFNWNVLSIDPSDSAITYVLYGLDSDTGYKVYQDGVVITTGTGPSFSFTATGGGEFEVVVWNTKTISTLVVLTINMVGLGIMVTVIFSWVIPFSKAIKRGEFKSTDKMVKELMKGVVFIVVGMLMYSLLWNVAIG